VGIGIDYTISGGGAPFGIAVDYNRYHQFGLDWAQVIAGFNLRAEAAANITDDLDRGGRGDDAVYNPAVLWSLGFDRDLFWSVNLNLQCNESIRLVNDEVLENPPTDIEAGGDINCKTSKDEPINVEMSLNPDVYEPVRLEFPQESSSSARTSVERTKVTTTCTKPTR
jgi:hypothetical protein